MEEEEYGIMSGKILSPSNRVIFLHYNKNNSVSFIFFYHLLLSCFIPTRKEKGNVPEIYYVYVTQNFLLP